MGIAIVDFLAHYKDKVFPVVQALASVGARAYLVGGCVRDMVLGLPLKDLDIEVHDIELEHLQKVLSQFGHVEEVGKKFGVLIILGVSVDWSLPRTDSCGRKPQVIVQPKLNIEEALQRRDLTMNAMAIDLTTVVMDGLDHIAETDIIDPFGGLADIHAKRMRAVDDAFFVQDPLRLLRVMQFVGRFEMTPSPELDALCRRMSLYDEYDNRPLARERIHAEVAKLLLQSKDPSRGFAWMVRIGRATELFPFLQEKYVDQALQLMSSVALRLYGSYPLEKPLRDGVKTPPQGEREGIRAAHPEEHPRCVSKVHPEPCRRDRSGQINLLDCKILLLAAACWPYANAPAPLSMREMLAYVTGSHDEVAAVDVMVRALKSVQTVRDDHEGVIACKKIAAQLGRYASLRLVSYVAWCVYEPACKNLEDTILYHVAQRAGVLDGAEPPLVLGRDLLAWVAAGPELGRMVAKAYQLQIEREMQDKDILIKKVLEDREDKETRE